MRYDIKRLELTYAESYIQWCERTTNEPLVVDIKEVEVNFHE